MRLYANRRDRKDRKQRIVYRRDERWSLPDSVDDFVDFLEFGHGHNHNPSRDDDPSDPPETNDDGDCSDDDVDCLSPTALPSNVESQPTGPPIIAPAPPLPAPAPPSQSPSPSANVPAEEQNADASNPSMTNTASQTEIPPTQSINTSPTPSPHSSHSVSNFPSDTATPETVPPGIDPSGGKDFKLKTGHIAAAILIPIILIILITVFVFLVLRRRRRRRRQHDDSRIHNLATPREMRFSKVTGYSPVVHTQDQLPQLPQPAMSGAHLASVPQPAIANIPPVPYARPQSTQPIILGPMNQSNTGNYYTGLDADAVSISESHVQGNGVYAMTDDPDEPPPPYRPRSIMDISREPSTRQPIHSIAESDESRRNLLPENVPPPSRSPFEDPDPDDDAVSDISEPSRHHSFRGGHDMMSAVSDLSYQNSIRRP